MAFFSLNTSLNLNPKSKFQILKDCFEKIKPCFPASETDNFKGLQRETFRQIFSSLTKDAKNKIDLNDCTPALPSTS